MQDRGLTLPHIFHRAESLYGHKRLITATPTGDRVTTVRDWATRVRQLAGAFDTLRLAPDGRVATFCWNSSRHLELYVAAPCSGRTLHTLNPRLFPEQLVYIINHAEDEIVFVDRSLLSTLWPIVDRLPTLRHIVVMDDGEVEAVPDDPRIMSYEQLLAGNSPVAGRFMVDDENLAAAMCYTSGTTGNPKGVVYSHRSAVLHALMTLAADTVGLSERDVVMPVVPMFHANAWGLPYGSLLAGSNIVFPGRDMRPDSLVALMARNRVTVTGAVPTLWQGMLPLLGDHDLSALRSINSGGSAVPVALSEGYREAIGLSITQAWGMTETSPLAAIALPRSNHLEWTPEQQLAATARQGQPVPLVELRIVDPDTGAELPWDDQASGELQVWGPWAASGYYCDEGDGSQLTDDGWLRTGDVAAIDRWGSIRLVDRTKDLIKSGGEWISSVALENEIMAHPNVAEAAVIAIPDERWDERPLACVVVRPGSQLTSPELLEFLTPRVPKWWLPEAIEFIDEVPKTSVGKFSKKTLRERYATPRSPQGPDRAEPGSTP